MRWAVVNNYRVLCRVAAVWAAAVMVAGCAELGVVGDGTTVSWGPPNEGVLVDGARLPREGEGFFVPPRWAARGTQYGTDELIDTIAHVGRAVAAAHPGSRVAVGDLSIPGGGRSKHHRSHQTGRDVDLVLFARDASGKQVEVTEMRHFGPTGKTVDAGEPLWFDAERQWTVVRALVEAPGPGVANIFLYAPLRDLVLDHARTSGAPDAIVDMAGALLAQPGDSAPHDDHMHVRVYCSPADAGCSDYASRKPPKKPRQTAAEEAIAGEMAARPRVGSMLILRPRW
jgi:penicillin-insensitive murein endopeptidase